MILNELTEISGVAGHYSGAFTSGVIVAAADTNREYFHFRWQPLTTSVCHVLSVVMTEGSAVSWTAGTANHVALFRARAWSVQGSDGTAITLGTGNKLDSNYPASQVSIGDIRIVDTANDGLNVGTKTNETHPLRRTQFPTHPNTQGPPELVLWDVTKTGRTIMLRGPTAATAEGLVITMPTFGAAGTPIITVSVVWAETMPA